MPVQFNNIPANARVPLFWAEINAAQANYQSNARLLLIGQMLPTGTALANEPIQIISNSAGMFGSGSMLADMYSFVPNNAPLQETWALPLLDLAAGVAAAGSILVTGVVTTPANFSLWIGGQQVTVGVAATDTTAGIAAKIVAAINAISTICVVASVDGTTASQVDLVAKHKGTAGNSIRVETNLYGTDGPVSSQILTITQPIGGSGDPVIATALANLGDEEFDFIAAPYGDAVSLAAIQSFLDGVAGRWSPIQQLYGSYVCVRNDAPAALTVFGKTRNDPHTSIVGSYNSPSPSWQWAAALGARMAAHLQDAPELSRPLQTLPLIGILPPKLTSDRPNKTTRQSFYYAGISSYSVDRAGNVLIDRVVTTYQTNAYGSPDPSWLSVNTLAQNVFAIRYLRAKVTGQWGRAALMDSNPGNIQGVATADDIRATILHGYLELNTIYGVVDNFEVFKALLIVERDQSDANRINVYLPMQAVGQLDIIAVNATSYLNFASAA